MRYFGLTLVIKLVIQVPAILLYEAYGPMIATTIAFGVGVYLFLRKVQQVSEFSVKGDVPWVLRHCDDDLYHGCCREPGEMATT
jgi:O-antigen/teichoic acid export membrane protein